MPIKYETSKTKWQGNDFELEPIIGSDPISSTLFVQQEVVKVSSVANEAFLGFDHEEMLDQAFSELKEEVKPDLVKVEIIKDLANQQFIFVVKFLESLGEFKINYEELEDDFHADAFAAFISNALSKEVYEAVNATVIHEIKTSLDLGCYSKTNSAVDEA